MQTFLPYVDFVQSAKCLDDKRLGKQRVEAYQILKVLRGETTAWANHPAVKMWQGCAEALAGYGFTICQEWKNRGFKDTLQPKFMAIIHEWQEKNRIACPPVKNPSWLGNDLFHASHRSNLLRKNYPYYAKYGWTDPPTLEYVWPVE